GAALTSAPALLLLLLLLLLCSLRCGCGRALRRPRHLVVAAAAATGARLGRPDRSRHPGPQIEPDDPAVLGGRVHDVGILGIVSRLKTVAAVDDVPVAGADAETAQGT